MRDRLKLPRAFIAQILAGSAEDCVRKGFSFRED